MPRSSSGVVCHCSLSRVLKAQYRTARIFRTSPRAEEAALQSSEKHDRTSSRTLSMLATPHVSNDGWFGDCAGNSARSAPRTGHSSLGRIWGMTCRSRCRIAWCVRSPPARRSGVRNQAIGALSNVTDLEKFHLTKLRQSFTDIGRRNGNP